MTLSGYHILVASNTDRITSLFFDPRGPTLNVTSEIAVGSHPMLMLQKAEFGPRATRTFTRTRAYSAGQHNTTNLLAPEPDFLRANGHLNRDQGA